MSGEIRLVAPADSVITRSVQALARFPTDEPWVLIGGIAVFIRLGSITRPTADADTIAHSQTQLLDRLVAENPTVLVANGDVTVPIDGVAVEVDVMDLADEPLPPDAERRAFAQARRLALDTALPELASWMAERIDTAFGKDLRYTLLRLRKNDRSAAAHALDDDTIAAVAILADVLSDELAT